MILAELFTLFGVLGVLGGIALAVMGATSGGPFAALGAVVGIAVGSGAFISGLTFFWFASVLRMLAENNERQAQCVAWLERHGTLLGRCVEALERWSPAPAAPGLGLDPSGRPVAAVPQPPQPR
jgi:hypothetical protein